MSVAAALAMFTALAGLLAILLCKLLSSMAHVACFTLLPLLREGTLLQARSNEQEHRRSLGKVPCTHQDTFGVHAWLQGNMGEGHQR